MLTAGRGAEALELLGREDISVIMSDQRMPEMTGVEFLSRARTVRPEATRLLITGYADLKAVIDAMKAPMAAGPRPPRRIWVATATAAKPSGMPSVR